MNLHQLAVGAITAVNPNQPAILRRSTGYTTAADGSRTPTYDPPVRVSAQVQDLSEKDLLHLEGLNVQGSQKVIYLNGELSGVVRVTQKGGDLVKLQDGRTWLTTQVIEEWPDWVKVSVTLQMDAPA